MAQMVMERKLESESLRIYRSSPNVYELLCTFVNTDIHLHTHPAEMTGAQQVARKPRLQSQEMVCLDVSLMRLPWKHITLPSLCSLIFKCC